MFGETANAVYFGNDNPGKRVDIFGRGGRQIWLHNPDSGVYERRMITVNPVTDTSGGNSLFNNTAWVDGVPNQSLEPGKPYYAYAFLPAGLPSDAHPPLNFTNSGFYGVGTRYRPSGAFSTAADSTANMEWTDPQGNICALVGMLYAVNDPSGYPSTGLTVASSFYGYPPSSPSSPRILTSPAPWLHNAAQPLSATTGMAGGAINQASMYEPNPQYHRIISCAWAWRGVWSILQGMAIVDTAGAYVTAQVGCKPLGLSGAVKTVIATWEMTAKSANDRVPLFGHNSLALDDGVYEFSFWARCVGGTASYNVTHTLHGWA